MARYDLTRFETTHNSYSGGSRGSLPSQLDLGIRDLELDFHDNGYEQLADYRVGHLKPGSEVALGDGNPETLLLRDWLGVINSWSTTHPGHGPITVTFDAKDDLTDNDDGGDLEDFNRSLEAAFGTKLYTRDNRDRDGAWRDTAELQDRFLCVLSGDGSTRAAYRWAYGSDPAIAVNTPGAVVLSYRSTAGDLNCWTGVASREEQRIDWRRKITYGFSNLSLRQPAIVMDDEGWLVAAHAFGPPPGFQGPLLESRVGRLQDDGRIAWYGSDVFGQGSAPSLSIVGNEVLEIHTMWDGQRRQRVKGVLDRRKRRVEWQSPRVTPARPFVREIATWEGRELRCEVDAEGVIVSGFTERLTPVRFRQVVFVEEQQGDDLRVIKDALFFAANAKERVAIAAARDRGLVVRAWGYEESDQTRPPGAPPENMPATDTPRAAWYRGYMTGPEVAV